jgi:hypothetical protein
MTGFGPLDPELLDAIWGQMQPLWTDESETLLRVVETDPEWIAVGDGLHDNEGYDTEDGKAADPLCPECGSVWDSVYLKLWEKGDFGICIKSYYCERETDHRWTESIGLQRMTTATLT